MPAGQQTHQDPFDELILADDDALHLIDRALEKLHVGVGQCYRVGPGGRLAQICRGIAVGVR